MKQLPLKIGLIGCGGIVQRIHSPAYMSMPELATVHALSDPSEPSRQAVAERHGVPPGRQHADLREMLSAGGLDAVVVATPHSMHCAQAVEALKAGVAVVSEKPMAVSVEEADAMIEAAERGKAPYAVCHNLLFSPAMREAFLQVSNFGGRGLGRSQSIFLKPPVLSENDWRATRKAGGGCLIDSAYHEIYAVEALMGSPVRYVEARVKTSFYEIDVDDLAFLLFEHANGAVSTVSSTWRAPAFGTEGGRWCEVHAEGGSVRVYHREKAPLSVFTRALGWKTPMEAQADATGHTGFFRAAFEALANGETAPVDAQAGRRQLAIIEAARRATSERRAVEVE